MKSIYYLIPIVVVGILYYFFFKSGRNYVFSGKDWFKKTRFDNTWLMLMSLLATNLTISGGIVASISGTKYYGPWFLLAPLSAAIGLIVFSVFHSRLASCYNNKRFFLADVGSGEMSPVLVSFGLASIFIGSFLAGWEIHIASQAIAAFYGEIKAISSNIFIISLVIAVLAGLYISRGGWDRSVFTDIVQTISVSVFVFLLALALMSEPNGTYIAPKAVDISTLSLWLFGAALFINNIGYSLVSPNNWQIAQSSGSLTGRLFIVGGVLLFLFSASVYFLSGYIVAASPFAIFLNIDFITALLVAVVPLFVWSTIDTSSVALSNLADRMLSPHIDDSDKEGEKLKNAIRKNYPLLFLIAAVLVSHILNTFQPNIFLSLLGATSSLIVFVPVIYAGLFTDNSHYLYSVPCSFAMFALFAVVVISSITLTLVGVGEWIFALSVAGFLGGSGIVYFFNQKGVQ